MNIRAASLFLLFFVFALPVQAQTPTPGGGRETIQFLYDELVALQARVATLESQVDAADLVALQERVAKLKSGVYPGFPKTLG